MQVKPWSHSALNSYESCPRRYFFTKIDKSVVEPPSEALTYGREVHKAIEHYAKKSTPFPYGMGHLVEVVNPFLVPDSMILVEQQLALDEFKQACGWFDSRVWVRTTIDLAAIKGPNAVVVDWKTGKRKEDDDQLALMAACLMEQRPEIEAVHSFFAWLQEPESSRLVQSSYTRADLGAIWARFAARVESYQTAHTELNFPPLPGPFCKRYCPVKQCEYNGG
jgi:CRISPR/Cas system-associated exonuclease Cas4 (RecB family)